MLCMPFSLVWALVFHQLIEFSGCCFSSHCECVETKAHWGDPKIVQGPMPRISDTADRGAVGGAAKRSGAQHPCIGPALADTHQPGKAREHLICSRTAQCLLEGSSGVGAEFPSLGAGQGRLLNRGFDLGACDLHLAILEDCTVMSRGLH